MPQKKKPAGRIITGNSIFLVRIDANLFFIKFDGKGDPLGVAIPSVAAHLSYEEADALCQKLKAAGFNGSVVTDIRGRFADVAALESARIAEEVRIQKFWGSRS